MALSLVFVIVKALTISSMINATFCLHCLARLATVLCVFTLYVTFSCLVIERTRIFVFVFKGQIMCKSSQLQTRPLIGWLAKSKPIRGLPDSKSLRNGCKIIVVQQICSKNEQNGGSCYCEDFITTWHENLNWTNLDTKQLFLQKAWLECDQIWVAYFFTNLFLLLFDHHPLGFADNLNQNKSTTFQRGCHVPFLSNCVELFALLNIYECIR